MQGYYERGVNMDSRLNLSEYAEEMIKKINACRDVLGLEVYEPILMVEIALYEHLVALENLVKLEKTIKSGVNE